jgi:hypothetical protein
MFFWCIIFIRDDLHVGIAPLPASLQRVCPPEFASSVNSLLKAGATTQGSSFTLEHLLGNGSWPIFRFDVRTEDTQQRRLHITENCRIHSQHGNNGRSCSCQQKFFSFCVRFEVFSAVTKKNVVFWDINTSSYLTGDTLRLRYRVQPVNAM